MPPWKIKEETRYKKRQKVTAEPPETKAPKPDLILTSDETAIIKGLMRDSFALDMTDLIEGEYSGLLAQMNDSQKLAFIVKLERLGIL